MLDAAAPGIARQAVPPATLQRGAWSAIDLPGVALGVSAHAGALWACGSNEVIAVSRDGGRNWTVKHFRAGGEALFALAWGDDATVFSLGTAGIQLVSEDGGETWKSKPHDGHPLQSAIFIDPTHALVGGDAGVGMTANAGRSLAWRNSGTGAVLSGLAALDATHGLGLITYSKGDGPAAAQHQGWVTTANQGRDWAMTEVPPSEFVSGIRGQYSRYEMYGVEISPDGKWSYFRQESTDGVAWQRQDAEPVFYFNCHSGGCLDSNGWVDLSQATPIQHNAPGTLDFMNSPWAAAEDSICRIATTLICTLAPAGAPITGAVAQTPPRIALAVYLRGENPMPPHASVQNHREGTMLFRAVIGPDGHVANVAVLNADTDRTMVEATSAALMLWIYRPLTIDGTGVDSLTYITVTLRIE